MAYKILSPRLGTPGDEFKPTAGVNIEALLKHGFIIEIGKISKSASPKDDKVETKKESTDAH